MKKYYYFLILFAGLMACQPTAQEAPADLVIYNGTIYTSNEASPQTEAVASTDGKISFVGSKADAEKLIGEGTKVIDLEGKTMIPGFIESHGHIMGIGNAKLNLDLMQVKNYDELIGMVKDAVTKTAPGEWILGRGWHQSKWEPQPSPMVKGFQVHDALSAVSPDNPVYLTHASGHASFANAKAMEMAGIDASSVFEGDNGEIIKDEKGNPTGLFNEGAQGLIRKHIPASTPERRRRALELAVEECLSNGITSFQDAGSGGDDIALYKEFVQAGKLGMHLWVMLSGGNEGLLKEWYAKGPEIDPNGHLTIRAIKLYGDGALGSRGAWLLAEYTDRPGHMGLPAMDMEYIGQVAKDALEHGFQVCVHAIGDRANQEVLDKFEAAFKGNPDAAKDHRYRVEHAQHLDLEDIPRFAELDVIASMQAIHMSSDRPWAIDRLGKKRIVDGAYVWQKLLQSGAKVINGTDAPVEPVSPIASFYASVSRRTLAGTPEGGYEPDQKMTREQALRAYTLDAAYGGFEENIKGSIEVGKLADFTILSQDIMTISEDQILDTEIVSTIVSGEVKWER